MSNEYQNHIDTEAAQLRDRAAALRYCDCNVWLGCAEHFPLSLELRADELSNVLSQYQISAAYVSHWAGYSAAAQMGNQALLDMEADFPEGTKTIWTALPLEPEEPGPLPGKEIEYGNIGGVRLFPASHRYRFLPWVVGDVCRWCGRKGLPVFIWHVELDWNDLYETAREFPDCNFILETQWQKILYQMRLLYGLLEKCPNIYVEISNLIGQDYLAGAVRRFGPERFIYGSFLPMNDPYIPMGLIAYSNLSDEAKSLIAGGNLRRLSREVNI